MKKKLLQNNNRKEIILRHIRFHSVERPYKCSFLNCNKRFSRKDGLKHHEQLHYQKLHKKKDKVNKRKNVTSTSNNSIPLKKFKCSSNTKINNTNLYTTPTPTTTTTTNLSNINNVHNPIKIKKIKYFPKQLHPLNRDHHTTNNNDINNNNNNNYNNNNNNNYNENNSNYNNDNRNDNDNYHDLDSSYFKNNHIYNQNDLKSEMNSNTFYDGESLKDKPSSLNRTTDYYNNNNNIEPSLNRPMDYNFNTTPSQNKSYSRDYNSTPSQNNRYTPSMNSSQDPYFNLERDLEYPNHHHPYSDKIKYTIKDEKDNKPSIPYDLYSSNEQPYHSNRPYSYPSKEKYYPPFKEDHDYDPYYHYNNTTNDYHDARVIPSTKNKHYDHPHGSTPRYSHHPSPREPLSSIKSEFYDAYPKEKMEPSNDYYYYSSSSSSLPPKHNYGNGSRESSHHLTYSNSTFTKEDPERMNQHHYSLPPPIHRNINDLDAEKTEMNIMYDTYSEVANDDLLEPSYPNHRYDTPNQGIKPQENEKKTTTPDSSSSSMSFMKEEEEDKNFNNSLMSINFITHS